MRFLSNLFSRGSEGSGPVSIGRVPPERMQEALELLLALPRQGKAPPDQVNAFIESSRARGIDLANTRVAMRGDRVLHAVLPSALPGRTLLLISGSPQGLEAAELAKALIRQAVEEYASADLCMMQALVDPEDALLLNAFEYAGFYRLAELIYLEVAPRKQAWKLPGGDWRLVPYSPEIHAEFGRTVLETYEGTLDCPGLNGVRGIDDVIEGHKASGEFDPRNWLLLKQGEKPAGVLLLARMPGGEALELVYVGLCPWARGKGLATELMKLTMTRASECGVARLTTAVDAKNSPAMKIYYRAGMQRVGSRVALLKVIHRAS